jgi:ankyrin repeat protein
MYALNECGWTALHHAIFSASPAAAEVLLSRGIDPDMPNDDGDRPWDIASRKDRYGHMAALERYGSAAEAGVAPERNLDNFGQ